MRIRFACPLVSLSFVALSNLALADCSVTNLGIVPLPEQGFATYKNFPTGLYPNFANNPPPAHLAAGLQIATNQIVPLDSAGNADTNNGKIVLLALGMSNTTHEWASGDNLTHNATNAFQYRANQDPSKNPQVVIVDGAIGGQDATQWTNANASTWATVITQRLVSAGVTTNQVQVMWLKQALAQPRNYGAFPAHAQALENDLAMILRVAKSKYPHLKLCYLSCRTRGYDTNNAGLNPEPFAFETGFADKFVIEDQINGLNNLNYNPGNGPVVAPWIAWGPYVWANGTVARSDSFVWNCLDVQQTDFTHPSTNGVYKVASQLLAFFKTDPTAAPWFLRKTVVGTPPSCSVSADVTSGVAPMTVHFQANFSGSVTQVVWTFDDGEFAFTNSSPTKIFPTPGTYAGRLTVTDTNGNTASTSATINVAAAKLDLPIFTNGYFQCTISGLTNATNVVQSSVDLTSWTSLRTNYGPFVFTDSSGSPWRFYRVASSP